MQAQGDEEAEYDSELEREAEEAAKDFYASYEGAGGNESASARQDEHQSIISLSHQSTSRGATSTAGIPDRNYDGIKCDMCGSISLDNRMYSSFDERVCKDCLKDNPAYKCMTKGRAKKEYLITDEDMRKLNYIRASNPRRPGWIEMKLYLVKQLEQAAVKRWGSMEAVEAEKKARLHQKFSRDKKRVRKAMKNTSQNESSNALKMNIKKLRSNLGGSEEREDLEASGKSDTRRSKKARKRESRKREKLAELLAGIEEAHEHVFAEPVHTGDGDWHTKACKECGFEVKFEQL